MHTARCIARPPAMHAPTLAMPRPFHHTRPPVDGQTPVKTLSSQTSFAGGNKYILLVDGKWKIL